MTRTVAGRRRPIPIWPLLRWALAILATLIAVLPIWWMVNVVFSVPGEPVAINPRLWPTSLSSGIDKI